MINPNSWQHKYCEKCLPYSNTQIKHFINSHASKEEIEYTRNILPWTGSSDFYFRELLIEFYLYDSLTLKDYIQDKNLSIPVKNIFIRNDIGFYFYDFKFCFVSEFAVLKSYKQSICADAIIYNFITLEDLLQNI